MTARTFSLAASLPLWLRHYQKAWLAGDLTAGLIVTVMLIPQSLAYALLAGLPPEVGLYASILPIVAYALLGSSMTLAVGPVAVASLMTASALAPLATAGTVEYAALAVQLSLLSGVMLLVFGALRLGFLAYFLSHPVISGFITGSAVVIAMGQLKHVLGVRAPSGSTWDTLVGLAHALPKTNVATLALGLGSLVFLIVARRYLARWLIAVGVTAKTADILAKLAPMAAVMVSTAVVAWLRLDMSAQVSVVGVVPQGLPHLGLALPGFTTLGQLWLPALLISLVGFVESVSVAQSLALKRQQRIAPDKELLGLGAANVVSALSGGYPVTGGFARSVVNFAAGAHTPLAGVVSAALMAVVIAFMTGAFYYLPHAVLAATIIVAVVSLVDFETLREAWHYDRADALSLMATALGVITMGVEVGILMGVALSLGVLVWRSSRPHMAVVGRVPGTEHFRNVARHAVETVPGLLALRVDESLFFANATALEDRIEDLLRADATVRRVLVVCSAVNQIDTTALGVLTAMEQSLSRRGITLELAEVKGPVMDRLQSTPLGQRLQGRVFQSVHAAFRPPPQQDSY
ncbi:SulP family inorganic anion transporter [Rhodoferax saidenbachensis]|uniref:Sodium-independent anion transporter n=1 Tax=Rhodoferax saidenbachensis TaxID=1484693 RepID=A0A1P8K5A3_9BURK|nr:sulfate permease [Rhodoferax saidenbachensis]APW41172.1 sodium-independent anion transporter [Rhodoferax saidenbachensis]